MIAACSDCDPLYDDDYLSISNEETAYAQWLNGLVECRVSSSSCCGFCSHLVQSLSHLLRIFALRRRSWCIPFIMIDCL
jgi:hypothetical protein